MSDDSVVEWTYEYTITCKQAVGRLRGSLRKTFPGVPKASYFQSGKCILSVTVVAPRYLNFKVFAPSDLGGGVEMPSACGSPCVFGQIVLIYVIVYKTSRFIIQFDDVNGFVAISNIFTGHSVVQKLVVSACIFAEFVGIDVVSARNACGCKLGF